MNRVGQSHTCIGIYGVHTVFLAGESPYIRSYTVCIYCSGHMCNKTHSLCDLTHRRQEPGGTSAVHRAAGNEEGLECLAMVLEAGADPCTSSGELLCMCMESYVLCMCDVC